MAAFRGRRRNLTLGKMPKHDAELFSTKLSKLIQFRKYSDGTIPPELQVWLEQLNEQHSKQLSDIGLFEYESSLTTVGQLFDAFESWYPTKKKRNGQLVSESSCRAVGRSLKRFPQRFKAHQIDTLQPKRRSLRANSEPVFSAEAEAIFTDLNSWQRNHYSPATWSRDNKHLRSIGIWAVSRGYCDYNPFTLMPSPGERNPDRIEHVTVEMAEDAISCCYDTDTALSFILGRFAGLRVPSELRTLKWQGVDFGNQQLTVLDSKKKVFRKAPMFDRVREALEKQHKLTGETRFVMSERFLAHDDSNNYNLMAAAVRRSGQELWDRLRHNLRGSCENDLLKIFPERLVCQYIGHTVKVSREHYQQQTADDYLNAIQKVRAKGLFS